MLWGYPGTNPSMTRTIRLGTQYVPYLGLQGKQMLWVYPGTYPGMTRTTTLGTRVPQSVYPRYDQNNQAWYPGTPDPYS